MNKAIKLSLAALVFSALAFTSLGVKAASAGNYNGLGMNYGSSYGSSGNQYQNNSPQSYGAYASAGSFWYSYTRPTTTNYQPTSYNYASTNGYPCYTFAAYTPMSYSMYNNHADSYHAPFTNHNYSYNTSYQTKPSYGSAIPYAGRPRW